MMLAKTKVFPNCDNSLQQSQKVSKARVSSVALKLGKMVKRITIATISHKQNTRKCITFHMKQQIILLDDFLVAAVFHQFPQKEHRQSPQGGH